MDARGLLIARDFRFQRAAAPDQLKRDRRALSHGPHACLVKLIRVSILEAMAVGMQIVSPNPISVRRCPSERVQDRMFLTDRKQMSRSGYLYEHR